mgnify:CR=1 FL=1
MKWADRPIEKEQTKKAGASGETGAPALPVKGE